MAHISGYEVFAIKYAERNNRTRNDSFLFDPHHSDRHPMDYFVWIIRNQSRTILVDTGYDRKEGKARLRPILIEPAEALADIGIDPSSIETCIITHLHYDHAGSLGDFENAKFHLQEREMAFATGACMCDPTLKMPYTADHICTMVKRVYSGKVVFHDGDAEVAPGVTVHRIGGHSRGIQAVRVETDDGPLVLASDTSHYYENFMRRKMFPVVVDAEDMARGFDRLRELAEGDIARIIPGHDPLVTSSFEPAFEGSKAEIRRLERGPSIGSFFT
ncbi:MAG: N-acyl homoserine lactonase family protein [Pseudomonadota bacterium]